MIIQWLDKFIRFFFGYFKLEWKSKLSDLKKCLKLLKDELYTSELPVEVSMQHRVSGYL